MTNPEKKFPGLKGMLITSLVVFILVVAWITVSVDGAQTPILNLVDTEPVMGLFAALVLIAVFAVSVYGGAGILIAMWTVYGIFLLVRHVHKESLEEGVADDDLCDG